MACDIGFGPYNLMRSKKTIFISPQDIESSFNQNSEDSLLFV